MELTGPRFGMIPLFLLAVVFSLLAPLYWVHVEVPETGGAGGPAHENQELYGRVLPLLSHGYPRVAAGEWPLWSSRQYCGVPFFANPIHGLLAPDGVLAVGVSESLSHIPFLFDPFRVGDVILYRPQPL